MLYKHLNFQTILLNQIKKATLGTTKSFAEFLRLMSVLLKISSVIWRLICNTKGTGNRALLWRLLCNVAFVERWIQVFYPFWDLGLKIVLYMRLQILKNVNQYLKFTMRQPPIGLSNVSVKFWFAFVASCSIVTWPEIFVVTSFFTAVADLIKCLLRLILEKSLTATQ